VAEFRLADPTKAQIREILARSEDEFGEQRRERYSALFVKAMEDVAGDPEQALVEWKRLSRFDIGTYHISHSRKHVKDPPGRVRNPKYVLVFSIARDGVVDFIGILHERMLRVRALRKIVQSYQDDL